MAVVKMGAVVTTIKGSIGGTAFKVQRGSQVMYRKSNGTSTSKLLQNTKLGYARAIFQRWAFLSSTDKNDWNALALTITFPDKFGDLVNITGRQLFTKCNLNLQRIIYYTNPTVDFTTVVPELDVRGTSIDIVNEIFDVTIDRYDSQDMYILVQVEVSSRPLNQPTFTTRKTLQAQFSDANVVYNIWPEFIAAFPNFTAADNVRCYFTPMNIYGIKSVPYVNISTIVGV